MSQYKNLSESGGKSDNKDLVLALQRLGPNFEKFLLSFRHELARRTTNTLSFQTILSQDDTLTAEEISGFEQEGTYEKHLAIYQIVGKKCSCVQLVNALEISANPHILELIRTKLANEKPSRSSQMSNQCTRDMVDSTSTSSNHGVTRTATHNTNSIIVQGSKATVFKLTATEDPSKVPRSEGPEDSGRNLLKEGAALSPPAGIVAVHNKDCIIVQDNHAKVAHINLDSNVDPDQISRLVDSVRSLLVTPIGPASVGDSLDEPEWIPGCGVSSNDSYQLHRKGLVFIQNNLFDTKANQMSGTSRKGAKKDTNRMIELFEDLNCVVFEPPCIDASKETLVDQLQRFKVACEEYDSAIVVLMSHGGQDTHTILSGDEKEESINLYTDIIYKFNHTNWKEGIGKPKIFIVEACEDFNIKWAAHQNDEPDVGITIPLSSLRPGSSQVGEVTITAGAGGTTRTNPPDCGPMSDTLVAHATIPYYTAGRTEDGALFIRKVEEVFRAHKDTSLDIMLQKVHEGMGEFGVPQSTWTYNNGFKRYKFNLDCR